MSENILTKALGILGKAFTAEMPCPYQNVIGEVVEMPPELQPKANYGDVPHVPPGMHR